MGKTIESRIGQRMQHRETLIGSSPRAARRRATGFELDHSFVQLPVFDTHGRLVHRRGVTASTRTSPPAHAR